jgi:hypothetical protein
MIHLGTRKGAGFVDFFIDGPTKAEMDGGRARGFCGRVNAIHKELNCLGKKIARQCFPRAHNAIAFHMENLKKSVPLDLGGSDGLVDDLFQSGYNLVNEPHVDMDISDYCFNVWSSSDESDPDGWYFVFPYLMGKDGNKKFKGVAIRLRNGLGIEWNGRQLFHCSTAPYETTTTVNGTFFGVVRV